MKKNVAVLMVTILLSLVLLVLSVLLVVFINVNTGNSGNSNKNKKNVTVTYEEINMFSLGKSVITNIKDSPKYVKCNFAIALGDVEEYNRLQQDEALVTDIINDILWNTPEENFGNSDIQETIKVKVKKRIEKELGIKSIVKLYTVEFIIQ